MMTNNQITAEMARTMAVNVRASLRALKVETKVEAVMYPKAGMIALRVRPEPGVKVDAITARHKDIQGALGVPSVRIDFAPAVQAVVVEAQVMPTPTLYTSALAATAQPYAMTVGRTVDGVDLRVSIEDATTPHALLVGTTGSGKTATWHNMLATICKATPELRVLTYDPIHEGYPWLMPYVKPNISDPTTGESSGAVSEPKTMVNWLKHLVKFMDDNKRMNGRILVCIDEVKDLIDVEPRIIQSLVRLAQRGRNHGIHLLCATQNPSREVLPADLVVNMPVRIVLAVASSVDSYMASGGLKIDAHKLPRPGAGILVANGSATRFVTAIPENYKKGEFGAKSVRANEPPILELNTPSVPDYVPQLDAPRQAIAISDPQAVAEPAYHPQLAADVRERDPLSYTYEERVRLLKSWNPELSIELAKKTLRLPVRMSGHYLIKGVFEQMGAKVDEQEAVQ